MPPESLQPTVVVRELEKRFGPFVAVNRISFDVGRGEIFGFLGPNGAGKSTVIRMLCGILGPTGGYGTVAGYDIRTEPEKIKASIGYMSQRFSLYGDLTVEENIDFFSGIYRIPAARKQARREWAIAMAGLQAHRHARTSILAGGWKQRLALGCAILHEPPILFLDEPTSGVDPVSRRQFWALIYDLAQKGVTVFVTTHYMDEAEYCDRIGLMYRGELIALGSPSSLKTDGMPMAILEVDCAQPQDQIVRLENLPGVLEVTLYGNRLHVTTDDCVRGTQGIAAALRAYGVPDVRIEQIPPSLEDVFVRRIEAYDRDHAPVAEVRR